MVVVGVEEEGEAVAWRGGVEEVEEVERGERERASVAARSEFPPGFPPAPEKRPRRSFAPGRVEGEGAEGEGVGVEGVVVVVDEEEGVVVEEEEEEEEEEEVEEDLCFWAIMDS